MNGEAALQIVIRWSFHKNAQRPHFHTIGESVHLHAHLDAMHSHFSASEHDSHQHFGILPYVMNDIIVINRSDGEFHYNHLMSVFSKLLFHRFVVTYSDESKIVTLGNIQFLDQSSGLDCYRYFIPVYAN